MINGDNREEQEEKQIPKEITTLKKQEEVHKTKHMGTDELIIQEADGRIRKQEKK